MAQNYFTPPTVAVVPTFLPDSTPVQVELWRHFANRERGVNVWVMSDNTVRQDYASPENSNTDLSGIYPWNPSNPSAPYVTTYYVGSDGTQQKTTTSHNPYPVQYFQGGTTTPINAAMVTLLTNYTAFGTGYAGNIT